MPKFSSRYVRQLKAPTEKSYQDYCDGNCLYLRVHKDGRKRWILRKSSRGKTYTKALGEFPAMELEQARAKAKEESADYVDMRKAPEISEPLLKDLADKWIAFKSKDLRPRSIIDLKWRLGIIKRAFGDRLLSTITGAELMRFVDRYIRDGKITTARYIVDVMAKLERYAISNSYFSQACLQFINKECLPKAKVAHSKTIEAQDLPALVRRLKEKGAEPKDLSNILILMLSLMRTNEACNLHCSYIDFDSGVITLPSEIMKAKREHRIPISRQLEYVLKERINMGCNKYICPKFVFTARPLYSSYFRVQFKKFDLHELITPHGIRALARTWFAERDFNFVACEMCLAHRVENATQQAYQRSDYLELRRDIMQQWGDYVEACFSAEYPKLFKGMHSAALRQGEKESPALA